MKEIPLTKGFKALVSDEDFDELSQYKWHVVENSARNENRLIRYARRWQDTGARRENGTAIYKPVYMHREITGLEIGNRELVPDHLDHNGLNNQRDNLEVVEFNENLRRKRTQQYKKKDVA